MPYRKFFEGGSEEQSLNELARILTDASIRVLWKHAETILLKKGGEKGIYGKTIFYVFYQDVKEELQQEISDFKNKLQIAKEVSMDERYVGNDKGMKALKNQRQRELFLLSEYFLSKTEAQDVIELLKPELAQIIMNSEKDVEDDVLVEELVQPTKVSEFVRRHKEIQKMKPTEEELDKALEEFDG